MSQIIIDERDKTACVVVMGEQIADYQYDWYTCINSGFQFYTTIGRDSIYIGKITFNHELDDVLIHKKEND
jgi:hypothetical protein